MKVFVDDFYYENVENTGKKAAIGTFDKYYRLSRNFIAELMYLGPILISVVNESDITRALVRSVLGFREYKYYNRHITGCPYFFSIKNSLSHYFNDTVEDWNYSEAIRINKRTSSIMGMLSSIFTFGGSWPLANDSNAAKKGMYSSITTQMMENHGEFLVEKVIYKMAEIGPEHAGELDREFHRRPIYVDVVGGVERVPFGLFGKKLINASDEDFTIHDDELNSLVISPQGSSRKLRHALLGFLLNELEYFNQLNEFYRKAVSKLESNKAVSETLFKEFSKVHRFEMEFLRSMNTAIEGLGLDLERVIQDPLYFADSTKNIDISTILLKDEEILDEIFSAFNKGFSGLRCYENLMLLHEASIEALEKYREEYNIQDLPSDRDMRDCFYNCLQRIVRYPLLVDDILRSIDGNDPCLADGKLIYLRIVKFIGIVDKKKEDYDNLRCKAMIQEKVSRLPEDVLVRETRFLDQLNCEDMYGEPVALFLLSNTVMVVDRKGPSISILDPNSKRYVSRCAIDLGKIEMIAFGKSGLKIVVTNDEENSGSFYQIDETYGDICVGVLYFSGCASHARMHFIEEFYKARIPSTSDSYASFGSLFFRILRDPLDVDKGSDLTIYTSLHDFESSARTSAGYLNLDSLSFELKGDMNVEYEYRMEQSAERFKDKFAESVVNAVQFKRALLASKATPKDAPQIFAKYKLCLREVVEKHSDAAVVEFGEKLSRVDLVTVSQKINKAKAIMGYINRSLSYMNNRNISFVGLDHVSLYNADRINDEDMMQLFLRILESSEIEDYIFDEYKLEDILYLLMYFIHTNIYAFVSLEDISAVHRMLFVEKMYHLEMVVSSISGASAPFISSLFDLIVTLRDKADMSSVLEAFLAIFNDPEVSKLEISTTLSKIHW